MNLWIIKSLLEIIKWKVFTLYNLQSAAEQSYK